MSDSDDRQQTLRPDKPGALRRQLRVGALWCGYSKGFRLSCWPCIPSLATAGCSSKCTLYIHTLKPKPKPHHQSLGCLLAIPESCRDTKHKSNLGLAFLYSHVGQEPSRLSSDSDQLDQQPMRRCNPAYASFCCRYPQLPVLCSAQHLGR